MFLFRVTHYLFLPAIFLFFSCDLKKSETNLSSLHGLGSFFVGEALTADKMSLNLGTDIGRVQLKKWRNDQGIIKFTNLSDGINLSDHLLVKNYKVLSNLHLQLQSVNSTETTYPWLISEAHFLVENEIAPGITPFLLLISKDNIGDVPRLYQGNYNQVDKKWEIPFNLIDRDVDFALFTSQEKDISLVYHDEKPVEQLSQVDFPRITKIPLDQFYLTTQVDRKKDEQISQVGNFIHRRFSLVANEQPLATWLTQLYLHTFDKYQGKTISLIDENNYQYDQLNLDDRQKLSH